MEQLIKFEFNSLKRHHKKHFDKIHKRIKWVQIVGLIATIVLLGLQLYQIIK